MDQRPPETDGLLAVLEPGHGVAARGSDLRGHRSLDVVERPQLGMLERGADLHGDRAKVARPRRLAFNEVDPLKDRVSHAHRSSTTISSSRFPPKPGIDA